MTTTTQVRAEHRYKAPPETVFDAFFDVNLAKKFMFATPTGEMVRAEIEPRVGGRFIFVDRRPEHGDVEHVGTWLEIDRPRRLVFEFAVPQYDPTKTVITIEIEPDGEGSRLTLVHDGVLEEYVKQTEHGWGMILANLETAL